jgi:hypothetical protein
MPIVEESSTILRFRTPGLIGRILALCFASICALIAASIFFSHGASTSNQVPLLSLLALAVLPALLIVVLSTTLVIDRATRVAGTRTTIAGLTVSKRELPLDQIKAIEIREHNVGGLALYVTLILDEKYRSFAPFGQFMRRKSAKENAERVQEFFGPK